MIRVLVCDDDINVTNQVEVLLDKVKASNNVEFETKVYNNSIQVAEESVYDIAIVDIEMPDVNGLELSQKLKEQNPFVIVIVLTSHADYLDSAMDISVFRYLSKPIDADRFIKNFVEAVIHHNNISKQIVIEKGDKVSFINTRDILYIENLKHGSVIVTKQGSYRTNKKPQEWMSVIAQPHCFVYSHKSYIVNLQNVIEFDKKTITFQIDNQTKTEHCISQRKHTEFRKAFFKFIGGTR